MNCENIKPLISEYADGRLDAAQRTQIQTHLASCAACAVFLRDLQTMGGLLRGLPVSQTSSQFEARLAARLAQVRPATTFRTAASARPRFVLWRPAIALGAAAAAIVGVLFVPRPPVAPAIGTTSVPVVGALVTQCVEQHRSYVSAQPLSDLAAQNLANQLDETASVGPSAPVPAGDAL